MLAFLFDRRSGLLTAMVIAGISLLLFGGGVLVGLSLNQGVQVTVPAPRWSPPDLPWKTPASPAAPQTAPDAAPEAGHPETSPIPGEWVPLSEPVAGQG